MTAEGGGRKAEGGRRKWEGGSGKAEGGGLWVVGCGLWVARQQTTHGFSVVPPGREKIAQDF